MGVLHYPKKGRANMIISREIDYAIRIVYILADNKMKSMQEICMAEHRIPGAFAYKIIKKLEQARIVESFRGVNGGYRLVKKISELTLFDIMGINKNALEVQGYLHRHNSGMHNRKCSVSEEFKRLENTLAAAFREKTLAQIFNMNVQHVPE